MKLAETTDDELREGLNYTIKQLKNKKAVVEKFVNACIYERIQNETRFSGLKKVLLNLISQQEAIFKLEFQKDMFDTEAQIVRKFNFEFWSRIEEHFN